MSMKLNGTSSDEKINWAPILGQWEISDEKQTFSGGRSNAANQGPLFPLGLAVSSASMQSGACQVQIRFSADFDVNEQAGGIVLGYRSPEQPYIFAELGAAGSTYSVGEYVSGLGWRPQVTAGNRQNLRKERDYLIAVSLSGQELRMSVDDVPVLHHLLPHPIEGSQVGLIAAGTNEVSFSRFAVTRSKPKAFVVMQFLEPYDTLYREVIQRQPENAGFQVFRIDEKAGPGVIFQDIQREIQQAQIVIAEITPANPNVYYEVGYAHALGKPTILLAPRGAGSDLPFDIRSFRVVFYNDSIGGKAEIESNLGKHLEAIAGR